MTGRFKMQKRSMFIKKITSVFIGLSILPISFQTHALGECGMACCLAGANSSGVTLAESFGLAVQYEYSDMETILHGSSTVSPDDVINAHWTPGNGYSVPTKMTMEKLMPKFIKELS